MYATRHAVPEVSKESRPRRSRPTDIGRRSHLMAERHYNAELASSANLAFAQALLDLVKAFERVPHHKLADVARKFNYPVHLLRLSIQAYRLRRHIVVDGTGASWI